MGGSGRAPGGPGRAPKGGPRGPQGGPRSDPHGIGMNIIIATLSLRKAKPGVFLISSIRKFSIVLWSSVNSNMPFSNFKVSNRG
jgi:hypothetical protein